MLDVTGLFDETFFMYGEDIDLSYRITQAGFNNYYYPLTRIIHYKGESTKKSSINYVYVFYKAMKIFATKHFSHKNAAMFSFLINIAIYLRAFVAVIHRLFERIIIPMIDSVLIFCGIYFLENSWSSYIINMRFKPVGEHYYPQQFITIVVPAYIIIWLISVFFSGGYDKPVKFKKVIQGIFIGTVVILVIYALLPESVRFSRALILLGAIWALISMYITRLVVNFINYRIFHFRIRQAQKVRCRW